VDEVDGRSPVERAAATFLPKLQRYCALQKTNALFQFFAPSTHQSLGLFTEVLKI